MLGLRDLGVALGVDAGVGQQAKFDVAALAERVRGPHACTCPGEAPQSGQPSRTTSERFAWIR